MTTATYTGDADQGMVDGILFPKGLPVEVDDNMRDRLEALEDYEVVVPKMAPAAFPVNKKGSD